MCHLINTLYIFAPIRSRLNYKKNRSTFNLTNGIICYMRYTRIYTSSKFDLYYTKEIKYEKGLGTKFQIPKIYRFQLINRELTKDCIFFDYKVSQYRNLNEAQIQELWGKKSNDKLVMPTISSNFRTDVHLPKELWCRAMTNSGNQSKEIDSSHKWGEIIYDK